MNILISFMIIVFVLFGVFVVGKKVSKKIVYTKEELVKTINKKA